jgi:hypothetical protein
MADVPEGTEKKIIVDEGWKNQVEAEREALRKDKGEPERPATPGPNGEEDLPPPSLALLANSLYLQAAISLGLLPNPLSRKAEVNLRRAKHSIDTLGMLQEKTAGNRTPEESEIIEEMLHQLRLAYLSVEEHAAKQASPPSK